MPSGKMTLLVAKAGWPSFDLDVARQDEIIVPIQINGKVRVRMKMSAGTSDETLRTLALNDPQVKSYTDGKKVERVVVAGGKLVSIVAK